MVHSPAISVFPVHIFILLAALFLIVGCINPSAGPNSGLPQMPGTGDGSAPSGNGGTDSGAPPGSDSGNSSPPGTDSGNSPGEGAEGYAGDEASGRAFIQYIVDSPIYVISQIVDAFIMAGNINLKEDDPLRLQLEAKAQAHIDGVVNNPDASMKELLEAIEIAQAMGLKSEEGMAKVSQKTDARIKEILNDPNAGIPDLLIAAELAQSLGTNEEGVYALVVAKIKLKLAAQINNPALCQKQLLEIAELAQGLGIDGVSENAMAAAPNAKPFCGKVNYTFTSIDKLYSLTTKITADITGNLKEVDNVSTTIGGVTINVDLGGFGQEGSRKYFFEDGKMNWTYDSAPETQGCIILKKSGSGMVTLEEQADGTLNVNDDGTFEGDLARTSVTIKVTKEKAAADPTDPHACDYITSEDLAPGEDQIDIDVHIEGTYVDRINLTGSYTGPATDEADFFAQEKATYALHLPDKLTRIKFK